MNKSTSIAYMAAFLAIIFGFAVASVLTPDQEFSTAENRALSKPPALSMEAIANRTFFEDMNQYVNDQLVIRDQMVRLYQLQQNSALFNSMLFENLLRAKEPHAPEDGTRIKDSRLISNLVVTNRKWILPATDPVVHTDRIDEAAAKLNDAVLFANERHTETFFIFNPSRTKALMHLYPTSMQTDAYARSKAYFLSKLHKEMNVVNIGDRFDAYTRAQLEELYFETDHHWNIKGAFAAYQEMISQLSAKSSKFEGQPLSLSDIRVSRLSTGSFEGSYNSQINYAVNPRKADRTVIYEPKAPFEFDRFEVIDKDGQRLLTGFNDFYGFKRGRSTYSYGKIYGGDRRMITYENSNAGNSLNVLLLKDSFMNPLTPYLARHFNKLTVMDSRYYSEFSLRQVLTSERFDLLLIAFHDDNLFSDTYNFEKSVREE
ncbi:DHHW family protein [Cohnella boryungensis]|uniref:DHHW family protein n=1 Tax=Cohnella boryungensis TaxID=768479 RepID=A0ABV8SAI0_9BACL